MPDNPNVQTLVVGDFRFVLFCKYEKKEPIARLEKIMNLYSFCDIVHMENITGYLPLWKILLLNGFIYLKIFGNILFG